MWLITVDFEDERDRMEQRVASNVLVAAVDTALSRMGLQFEKRGGYRITATWKEA